VTRIKFGKKGIAAEYVPPIIFFTIVGIMLVIAFLYTHFNQMGGPPTGADQVMKYYNDMLKGEIAGEKMTPTAIVLGFFIPLLTTFSIMWALLGILPVFREATNKPAAAVLAFGISIYATPTMHWMILIVFPPMLGVSSVFIAIAAGAGGFFIMITTLLWFTKIRKSAAAVPSEGMAERGGWPFGREEEETEESKLRGEVNDLVNDINGFLTEFDRVIRSKKEIPYDSYGTSINNYSERVRKLTDVVNRSKLKDWQKETDKNKLAGIYRQLRNRYESLRKLRTVITCPHCKTENRKGDKYCINCGRSLESDGEEGRIYRLSNDLIETGKKTPGVSETKIKDLEAALRKGDRDEIVSNYNKLNKEIGEKGVEAAKSFDLEKNFKDLIKGAKEVEEKLNKVKEDLPEDLRKKLDKLHDLIVKAEKIQKTGSYNEKRDSYNELLGFTKDMNKIVKERKGVIKKEETEDEKLRAEWYRNINAIGEAGEIIKENSKHLKGISQHKISNVMAVSNTLKDKCKNLLDKSKRLADLANEMKNIFKKEKILDNALEQYRARRYFRDITTSVQEVLNAVFDIRTAYPNEAKKKLRIMWEGKIQEKTYAEAFPDMYNKILPDLLRSIEDNAKALSVQYEELTKLIQQTAKRES